MLYPSFCLSKSHQFSNHLTYNSENKFVIVIYYIFFVFYRGLVSEERGHGKNQIAIRNLGSCFN